MDSLASGKRGRTGLGSAGAIDSSDQNEKLRVGTGVHEQGERDLYF